MKLLVAEDSETILLLLERRLSMAGFDVQTARNGQEALEVLEGDGGESPDVIVLDAMMPGKSGFEVLREIRDAGDETPVLIVSAHRTVEQLQEAIDWGADGCMTKPIDWDELISKIEELGGAAAKA